MEVTTGFLILVFCITATISVCIRCSPKPCIRIPWKKTANRKDEMANQPDGGMRKNVSKFSWQDLEVACEDFSNIIGSSPNSIVYRGTLQDGIDIAVVSLCISEDQWTNYYDFCFQAKVADLARINHDNTTRLLGYCQESDPLSRMLVFEYESKGTLYDYLHYGEGYQLSWLRRMRIILGIARGLRYLHRELQPPVVLSELNSNTVYLTEDFSPKVADFDSWKMTCSKSKKNDGGFLRNIFGSFGQRQMDIQRNTLSFGVLLLEIIGGRPPYCEDRRRVVGWKLLQEMEMRKLVDPELTDVKLDDLKVICSVVRLCIERSPSERPSMQVISRVLEIKINVSDDAISRDIIGLGGTIALSESELLAHWKDEMANQPDGGMLKNVSKFSRQDLEVACKDFSNIIGSCPNSIVYSGTLKDGIEIAVVSLCISEDQWTNYYDFCFQAKVADLARINHDNTTRLLGYCQESDPLSRMIVFEYESKGTLYDYLHYGEGYKLCRLGRLRIVLGIARGLRYLHRELQPPVALSELNSNTVYLTEDFSPKVADFNSWKMICLKSKKNDGDFLRNFFGSFGQRQMDIQRNTLSFGVLLLEIIGGRPPYCEDRRRVVDWELLQGMERFRHPEEIRKLVGPVLRDDDLEVICSVVRLFIERSHSERPSMQAISRVLENGIDFSDDVIF